MPQRVTAPARSRLRRWKRSALEWFTVHVFGRIVLPLLVATWKVETDFPEEWLARAQRGERVILAFWHNRQLGLLRLTHLLQPVKVLVSRHGDGEIIARIATRFRVGAVRGSSTRGGAAALREMLSALDEATVAITPDGPVGPRYEVKSGVITLAALSERPVFWVSWSADRAWAFRSWDRFLLPKPFATLRYRADGPLTMTKKTNPEDLATARAMLEASMRDLTATLDREMGLEPDPILEETI